MGKMKKIGIIGGSFDPIHYGHLILAEQVRVESELSQVVFMPAYISPFKQNTKAAEAADRLEMVRLATEGNPYFTVSDMEIGRQCVSYTAETLRKFQEKAGEDAEIYFITGTDAFMSIEEWRDAEFLLCYFSFIIGLRPGVSEEKLDRLIGRLRKQYGTRVIKVWSPKVDISSSHIRELISEGKSARYLLPDPVLEYIEAEGLYRLDLSTEAGAGRAAEIRRRITDYIRAALKPSRLLHTEGVVKTASALAVRYGVDPEKAELCALFHDSCRSAGNLEHGRIAAEMMKKDYNILDEDMINAVKYHTTGREGMSQLEKILYLADAIEPSRAYPGVEELRRLAEKDLNGACLAVMEHSIRYVRERGLALDENTVRARDYLLKRREHE